MLRPILPLGTLRQPWFSPHHKLVGFGLGAKDFTCQRSLSKVKNTTQASQNITSKEKTKTIHRNRRHPNAHQFIAITAGNLHRTLDGNTPPLPNLNNEVTYVRGSSSASFLVQQFRLSVSSFCIPCFDFFANS